MPSSDRLTRLLAADPALERDAFAAYGAGMGVALCGGSWGANPHAAAIRQRFPAADVVALPFSDRDAVLASMWREGYGDGRELQGRS